MRKLGVIGTLVRDEIHGRTPGVGVEHEWGGVAYALAALDAALTDDWEIVPLITVGRERALDAARLLEQVRHRDPAARLIEIDAPTPTVTLHYVDGQRRCGGRIGVAPSWTWQQLGPMVHDLDALYVNFVTGDELSLDTALALRAGFHGRIYADLHQLVLPPIERARDYDRPSWFRCFDVVQLNEAEMLRLGGDALGIATRAIADGATVLLVTLGDRGAVYVTSAERPGDPLRTALVGAPHIDVVDTTGCGDVFGATCAARLLEGASLDDAVAEANRVAARNAGYRGTPGLGRHLRGALVTA